MKKLGLTLLLSCFIFLFSFVPVFATESAEVLITTDSIFPLEVGDVLPVGLYVFNDVIDFSFSDSSFSINMSFNCDGLSCTNVYFYKTPSGSAYHFSYRPDLGIVYYGYQPNVDTSIGWVKQSYRYIDIVEPVEVTSTNIDFLNNLSVFVPNEGAVDILGTFDNVFDGFLSLFDSIVLAFWIPNEGLTFIGVLAVISLGIAISFLIFTVIRRFLRFRG